MKISKKIAYKIKCLVPALGLAGATILPNACCKTEQEPEEITPTHDAEITFFTGDADKKLDMKILQELANDKTIRYIYMTATDHWNGCDAKNISNFRKNFFQPRIELSPKIRGRGDFDFKLGEASKVPDDSLWYVQNGWTINKQYQK